MRKKFKIRNDKELRILEKYNSLIKKNMRTEYEECYIDEEISFYIYYDYEFNDYFFIDGYIEDPDLFFEDNNVKFVGCFCADFIHINIFVKFDPTGYLIDTIEEYEDIFPFEVNFEKPASYYSYDEDYKAYRESYY